MLQHEDQPRPTPGRRPAVRVRRIVGTTAIAVVAVVTVAIGSAVPATAQAPGAATAPAAPPPAPPQRDVVVDPSQIDAILATIRYLESRGNYTAPPNSGNASGAYQFIASTWNGYGGYPHAYLAPPEVQDERAAADVRSFLARFGNDVSMVPVMWYYPRAVREPALMDVVPKPENGNRLTIREYQTRWLAVFAFISGQPVEPQVEAVEAEADAGDPPLVPDYRIGDAPAIVFPALGPTRIAVPECDEVDRLDVGDAPGLETSDVRGTQSPNADEGSDVDGAIDRPAPGGGGGDGGAEDPSPPSRVDAAMAGGTGRPGRLDVETAGPCTEHAPAMVFGVKLQPVLAVADGVVTEVVDRPGTAMPITLTITDTLGMSYLYSGFNDDSPGTDDGAASPHLRLTPLAEVGTPVRAGQIIGFMGDTDPLPTDVRLDVPTDASVVLDADAVAPHIRLSMVDRNGDPVDAFGPVADALFRQSCTVAIGPWSVPAGDGGHAPVVVETTDDDDAIDSEWIVTETGQVTARGWAAMVNPNEGCGYAPATVLGPGAGGAGLPPDHWSTPVELSTSVWVALAVQDEVIPPGGLLRPG